VRKRRLLYSGFTWDHHDENSGYQKIVASQRDYVDGSQLWGGKSPWGSLRRKINFFLIDVCTVLRAWRYDAVLIFYPELTAYISPLILSAFRKKVFYTLHLRPDHWNIDALFVRLKRLQLRFVDGFIVLSIQQLEIYSEIFPGRVVMIPHGAHVPPLRFQCPAIPRYISVIGDSYRDYDQLAKIILAFSERLPEVKFHLIGMKYEKLGGVENLKNVICHPRLEGETYRSILGRSTMILLPLLFATANNALLEGLAVGVPVYCSNVAGVFDYLPDQEYVFSSAEDAIAKFEQAAMVPPEELEKTALRLNQSVHERYSWDVIQKRVVNFCLRDAGKSHV
jgi:glycosyltransferase involved in cell wall biosynthesis